MAINKKINLLIYAIIFFLSVALTSCDDGSSGNNNRSNDTDAPEVNVAFVYSSSPDNVSLAFSENITMDNSNGFTVNVLSGYGAITLTGGVTGSESANARIALSRRILHNEIVTLSYDSSTGNVRDMAGNAMESFMNTLILTDAIPPVLVSARVDNLNPNRVIAQFSEPVEEVSSQGFVIYDSYVFPEEVYINDVSGSGTAIMTFILDNDILFGSEVTIEYSSTGGSVLDLSGNPLQSFGPAPVATDDIVDTTAPQLVNADIAQDDGYNVVLHFNEGLSNVSPDGFTVTVNEQVVVIDHQTYDDGADDLYLVLETRVNQGDAVAVSYDSGTGTVTDIAGNPLASFGPQDVENNFVLDETPPTMTSAFIIENDTRVIYLAFSEEIDNWTSAGFTVTINGSPTETITSNGSSHLELGNWIHAGETVAISYNSGAGTVTDLAGNPLASFGPQVLENNLVADTNAPQFESAFSDYDDYYGYSSIYLLFSEFLNNVSLDGFTVTINGVPPTITDHGFSGDDILNYIYLEVEGELVAADTVVVSYNSDPGTVVDAVGNPLGSFGPVNVPFGIPPFLDSSSIGIADDNDTVALVFNEDLSNQSSAGFTVRVNNTVVAINSTTFTGSDIYLNIASSVSPGDAVTVQYNSGTGTIENTNGVRLGSFGPREVPNYAGAYTIETFPNGGGSDADTILTLYDSSYQEITHNDDYGGDRFSRIMTLLFPGETYYISVEGYSGLAGYYSVLINQAGGGSSTVTPDENVDEDNNDAFATAPQITIGTVLDSYLSEGDIDYYVFTVPE